MGGTRVLQALRDKGAVSTLTKDQLGALPQQVLIVDAPVVAHQALAKATDDSPKR